MKRTRGDSQEKKKGGGVGVGGGGVRGMERSWLVPKETGIGVDR